MGFPRRQTSEASSTTSTAPPATPASQALSLPQCGSLATMDVPWSPMSHVDGDGVHRLGDDDVDLDDEEDDERTNDDEEEEELGEFVCYGDRVCLLCDGQLLALTRKFNLSYQQMALLATATLLSGGLLGAASLLIWRKGLFRKRYAALLSDLVYRDAQGGGDKAATTTKVLLERHIGQMSSAYDASAATQQPTSQEDDDVVTRAPPPATGGSDTSKTLRKKAQAVTFRIFEYDPVSHAIKYGSLGQPVQFGAPVVVAHAASRRAIRYKPHHGAVTISRPPRNPHFRRDVKEGVALIDASLAQASRWSETPTKDKDGAASHKHSQKERPKSLTTTFFQRVLRGGGSRSANDEATAPPASWRSKSARDGDLRKAATMLASSQPPASLGPLRTTTWSDPTTATNHSDVAMRRRASQPPHFRGFTSETAATALDAPQPAPEPRRGSASVSASASRNLYRSISESCLTLMRNLNDSVQHQKERHVLKKRRRLLLKDLPNMAFPERDGKYFVARLQAPVVPLFRSESAGFPKVPPVELPSYLRWGAPMQLVADYNGNPCGFHSREYYRDAQQYMSTEGTNCSPATIIPIPENGNLQAIAKESVRRVANMERRQVRLRVGTYNVWMMPRKISMFASVSPKKNTRAKLIADVLPPCDVWVFTECFDHRARSVLLDKLKRSGGYYFNSPTVGHKRRGPDGRYLDKLLNGGVVLASKYPILSVRIKLFREVSAGSDRFADKGVLYCKILKDGLLVHVFSTHLQAWNDELSRSARRLQLKIIAEMMASMGIDETVDCVLYVGDLNVNMWLNKQNGEYDEMLEILDAHDTARGTPATTVETPVQETTIHKTAAVDFKRKQQFSFDGRLNPLASDGPSSDGSLELLDYVLYSKSHRQPAQAMSYVQPIFATAPWVWKKTPQYHLSDHFPVISELTFDMWRE